MATITLLRRALLAVALAASCLASYAAGEIPSPQIHGALRTRLEMTAADHTEYRFQVRYARVTLGGDLNPSIKYFIQTDLCDRGKMKILDAWGRIALARGLYIQAGQFRMPFGVETFRAPTTYIFANRSYLGKTMCNYRAVGAKMSYTLPSVPVAIEAGAFNPRAIGDHNVWQDRVAASGKVTWSPGDWSLSSGIASLVPDSVRANLADIAVTYRRGRWQAHAEYMYEHYTGHAHPDSHAWTLWADYRFPVKAGIFNSMSVQGRYDGLTNHASLASKPVHIPGEPLQLVTDSPTRNRLTAGVTLTAAVAPGVAADIHLNYEYAMYHHDHTPSRDEASRALIELAIRF